MWRSRVTGPHVLSGVRDPACRRCRAATGPAGADETAAIAAAEVRTGLTPALPIGAVWPDRSEATVTVEPAVDATVMQPPPEATADSDATFVGGAAPGGAKGLDIDQTVMPAPHADATVMQAPGEAATMMTPPARGASPDTDATIMQPLPDAATMAGPAAPPARRSPTSRPPTNRPPTNRPPTNRPSTNSGTSAPTQHMSPGDAFGTRYQITKMLGVGGMGAVYQAWDAELGVAVAIKTIRPGVGTDASTALDAERRFKRELLLAAK
jgi:hypothetical protein